VLHKFVDFNGIMILVRAVDGQTDGTNKSSVLAVGVNTDKGGVLSMRVAVIRFNELLKAFRELLNLHLDRHL
jgi:hypothetical protein